jgi:GntR family galactonate operon transcriptional repressor
MAPRARIAAIDRDVPTGALEDHRISRPLGLVPTVVDALLGRVVAGEFAEHRRPFPREAELVEQYGVSRTVVREALRVLEAKGLISIRQGRSTTALGPQHWDILDPQIISGLFRSDRTLGVGDELMDMRAALEAEMVRLAAGKHDSAFLADLDAALRELDEAREDVRLYLNRDRTFHDVIMQASGNRFARRIVSEVFVWTRRSALLSIPLEQVQRTHAEHVRIRDLIVAGDGEQVVAVMRDHILGSWQVARAGILAAMADDSPST